MLHQCALRMTDLLYQKCPLDEGRRNVYIYGCELAMSTLLGVISMALLSFLLFRSTDILAFFVFFMLPRLFSGGFHAKTYGRCFILSNILFLCYCLLVSCLTFLNIWWISYLLAALSSVVILRYAPIRNVKHPFSEVSYQRNKRISHVITVLQLATLAAMAFSAPLQAFYTAGAVSMTANAFMMIIATIENRREELQ